MKKTVSVLLALVMTMSLAVTAFAAGLPFVDVPTDAWYYEDVKRAYESGLINGKDATHFYPDANLTYAEAIKLAACMNQLYFNGYVNLESTGGAWYQSYVDYARAQGIISKNYPWDSTASRAGYVEIFAHALPESALQGVNEIPDDVIPDVKMNHPQAYEIYLLYRAGILTGSDSTGTFNPNSSIKRCEVAAILSRMMEPGFRRFFELSEPETDTIDSFIGLWEYVDQGVWYYINADGTWEMVNYLGDTIYEGTLAVLDGSVYLYMSDGSLHKIFTPSVSGDLLDGPELGVLVPSAGLPEVQSDMHGNPIVGVWYALATSRYITITENYTWEMRDEDGLLVTGGYYTYADNSVALYTDNGNYYITLMLTQSGDLMDEHGDVYIPGYQA